MSEFSIIVSKNDTESRSDDLKDGEEIPKKFGYKFENKAPYVGFRNIPANSKSLALIMDDPDAMAAVGKVWVHWLACYNTNNPEMFSSGINFIPPYMQGKNDFGEIGYGGPAPPDKRHTYVFKAYSLDVELDLKEGYSKQELEDAMKGHIIAEAKLTGTYAP